MNKVFTFVMALCLVAGASATPQWKVAQPQTSPSRQQILPAKQNTLLMELSKDVKMEAEVMAQMPKIRITDPKMFETNIPAKNAVRKAAQGEVENITIDSMAAMYLGTYYDIMGYSAIPAWQLTMVNNDGDTVAVSFVGYSDEYIEGYYRNVQGAVKLAGEEAVDVSGTLEIVYKGTGTSTSPTYTFTAELKDSVDNVYSVSVDYAFDNNRMEVMDMGWLYMYMYYYTYCQYGYTQACQYAQTCSSYILMELSDAPVEPSGLDPIEINITDPVYKSYYNNGSYWVVEGTNELVYNSLSFYSNDFENVVGEYTYKDFYLYKTQLYEIDGEEVSQIEIYKPISLVVTQSGDTTYYKEVVMGRDGNNYIITMFYTEPEATEEVILFTYGNFSDYTAEEGAFMANTISGDTVAVSFAVCTETVAGTYTTKDSYNGGYYNYVAYFRGNDTIYYDAIVDTIKIVEVTGTYKDTADYIALVKYKAQNYDDPSDVKWFIIYMNLVSYYKYDATTSVSQTYTEGVDNIQFVTDNFEDYGCVFLMAQKADKSDFFYGMIYPEEIDETYTLPLGEYVIDNSEDENTMYASAGYSIIKDAEYPTYYATKTASWYITSGTFKVEDGKMTLAGKNTLDKDVNIIFYMNPAGIMNINAENQVNAAKVMMNGQLIILKNGKMFNLQGNEVK